MLVGHCQRSDDVVEPRLKTQWFVRTAPLAEKALASVREGRTRIVPAAVREGLLRLARKHPGLERQPPALVGAPHPGVVLPRRARDRERHGRVPGGLRRLRAPRRRPGTGRRHFRHLVLKRSLAILDTGLAGPNARSRPLLSRHRDGDGLRHHLLLGRQDDDARRVAHGRDALPARVLERPDPRPLRPEDVEDEGQRDRSARSDP